jgi:uncharacterized membrane protein YgaE (UPF0421/DUF939 family)
VTGEKIVGLVAFVLRCTAAATLAYLSASAIGLPHPLWACIFALIASQDKIAATFTTIGGRAIGTIIGVIVVVAVGTVMNRFGLDMILQMAVAVAICAVFAWKRPAIQLCLWTPPIVLMSMIPGESIASVGFYRGSEVILGGLIGGLLLIATEKIGAWAHQIRSRSYNWL